MLRIAAVHAGGTLASMYAIGGGCECTAQCAVRSAPHNCTCVGRIRVPRPNVSSAV